MQAMCDVLRIRRCFQFSLRTLFALVTVLCVWLGSQLNWIRERHQVLRDLEQSSVVFGSYKPAPWSIRLIERGIPSIAVDADVARDAQKVKQLKRLFPESTLCTPIDGLPVSRSPNPGFALRSL